MPNTTRVVIHEPEHRRRSIAIEADPLASRIYDHNIRAYFEFLRHEGGKSGFDVQTDRVEADAMIQIEGESAERRKAVHAWFAAQPDIWNWLPSVDVRGFAVM